MNVYLAKFMTYYEIHRLCHLEGRSVSWISQHLVLNRRTVKKYLTMDEQDYEQLLIRQSNRSKKLDAYEGFVRNRLESHRDTTSAQMHDHQVPGKHFWLQDCVQMRSIRDTRLYSVLWSNSLLHSK